MSEIRVNTFKAEDGISAPSFPNGIQVTGVVTATSLASSVPHLNVGNNIQLGAAGVATATSFVGPLTGTASLASNLTGTPNITVGTVIATTGTFSGNVSIGGTLTYEDVVNVDSVGIVTAREGVFIPDTKELKLGNTAGSPDLKLYSTGTNGWVYTPQSGADLYMGTDAGEVYIQTGTGGNDVGVKVNSGGSVDLYFNNSPKLSTSNTGISVTGAVAATGSITDDKGDVRKIIMKTNGTNNYNLILSDVGKAIHSSADVVVPNSVFSAGDTITLINSAGSNMSVQQGSGVTMYNTADGATGNRTLSGKGMATVYFVSSSTCYITGSGLT